MQRILIMGCPATADTCTVQLLHQGMHGTTPAPRHACNRTTPTPRHAQYNSCTKACTVQLLQQGMHSTTPTLRHVWYNSCTRGLGNIWEEGWRNDKNQTTKNSVRLCLRNDREASPVKPQQYGCLNNLDLNKYNTNRQTNVKFHSGLTTRHGIGWKRAEQSF